MALPAFERHQAGVVVIARRHPVGRRDRRRRLRGDPPAEHPTRRRRPRHPGARARPDARRSTRRRRSARGPPRFGVRDDRFRVEAGAGHGAGRRRQRGRGPPRRPRTRAAPVQHAADRLVDGDGLMATLTFFGWWRPPGAAAVSSGALTAGRLSATLAADRERPRQPVRLGLPHAHLRPVRARRRHRARRPAPWSTPTRRPGARNVEIDKAVYAELGAPDLPWRHTVALPQGKALRPWLVLLVGTADEIEVAGHDRAPAAVGARTPTRWRTRPAAPTSSRTRPAARSAA